MMLRLWSVLLANALIICQMYISEAAPSRTNKDSLSDGVTLSNDDAQSLDRPMSKRCTSLSTCVLGKLSQDIHKLQTFPRTDVGAGTPGKKRSLSDNTTAQKRACNTATCVTHRLADFLSRSGGLGHSNFVPTNVGAQAFGRRKRHGPDQE
ncbi:hypothetical protein INR49_004026 [Caranx melampygus]|nr:hypothetical protein INR49_004026 [Caranx melampygus]